MPAHNTLSSYGLVARSLHWLTALLILTAIPLGLVANGLGVDPDTIATKAQLFSLHKTLGVSAFLIGVVRVLWALIQPRPVSLHPGRKLESTLAGVVHWLLYLSLVIVPLSGWVHHAALDGFAPILWPFGQGLPFVPKSDLVADVSGAVHWLFTKLLALSILLHVAGALKHHFIDRDETLLRMVHGVAAPANPAPVRHGLMPFFLALAVYGLGTGLALSLVPTSAPVVADTVQPAPATQTAPEDGTWQVASGTLLFSVQQMGAPVEGRFAGWTAEIRFDDTVKTGKAGSVTVDIDLATLALGSVTDQAKGPEFFDVANHPKARFAADIMVTPAGHDAVGVLQLHGKEVPLTLPLDLKITGDTADLTAAVRLDRRDFGIGAGYADEATVGFGVDVAVVLTAKRP